MIFGGKVWERCGVEGSGNPCVEPKLAAQNNGANLKIWCFFSKNVAPGLVSHSIIGHALNKNKSSAIGIKYEGKKVSVFQWSIEEEGADLKKANETRGNEESKQ